MPSIFQRMRSAMRPVQKASNVTPFFNVTEQTETEPAEITLYGDVLDEVPVNFFTGEPEPGDHITVDGVLTELERVRDATEIRIRLNSSGGDLFAGVTIHNRIKSFPGHKTVVVDGLAASAASVIMCAGDVVQVHPGSMVMIHNVASFLYGFYSTTDIKDMVTAHEAAETSIKRIYGAKTGKTDSELQTLIDDTTWYVGQDAIDAGFADELIEDEVTASVTDDGRYLMVAGIPHLVDNLGALPSWINQAPNAAPVAREYKPSGGATSAITEEEGEMTITNAAELRSAYPDLVAEIEADAVTEERERIRSIDEISGSIHNPELINRAKYAEPMSAGDLALASIQAEGRKVATFLNDLAEDAQEAVQGEVTPAPVDETPDEGEAINALMSDAAAKYNDMKGRR